LTIIAYEFGAGPSVWELSLNWMLCLFWCAARFRYDLFDILYLP